MPRGHQYRRRPHGFAVQIDGQPVFVLSGRIPGPFLDIVLLLCPEGDEFSFALSAASLVDEEQAALMLMKEPCDVCKISEAAAFIAMA